MLLLLLLLVIVIGPSGVISQSALCFALGRFEITSPITSWIVWHKVQLLIINRNYNKIREEYGSGINYLTGWYIQLLS